MQVHYRAGKGRELPAGSSASLLAKETASAYLLAPGGQEGLWPSPQSPRVVSLTPLLGLQERIYFFFCEEGRVKRHNVNLHVGKEGDTDVPPTSAEVRGRMRLYTASHAEHPQGSGSTQALASCVTLV